MSEPTKQETAEATGATVAGKWRDAHRALWRNFGMLILLLLLVTSIFVLPPIVPEGRTWRVLADVMVTLIIVSGVIAIADHRKLALLLGGFALLVIVGRWAEWLVPAAILSPLRILSSLCGCLVLAFAVGINVFVSARSIGDRLFGAIVLYLLIGLTCALNYAALYAHDAGAFSKLPDGGGAIGDWLYFSFVTLTTVGYGDITPVGRVARSLAMFEALVGQLYPAIIIARLVSLPGNSKP